MEGHEEQLIPDVLLSHGFKETGRFLKAQLLPYDNRERVVQPANTCIATVGRVSNHLYVNLYVLTLATYMKSQNLHVRISQRRMMKLKAYAESKEKTMTQLVEDWIDRLPVPEELEVSVPPTSRSQSPP